MESGPMQVTHSPENEKIEALTEGFEDPSNFLDRDALELARIGKKQVLRRRFGLISLIGLVSNIMLTWEGVLEQFTFALVNGGPAGSIYSFLITWFGAISVYVCLAEMASMLPTVVNIIGSAYLHHKGRANFLATSQASLRLTTTLTAMIDTHTGWITVLAWISGATFATYLPGQLIFATVQLKYPQWTPSGWEGTVATFAFLALSTVVNTVTGGSLPGIETGFLLVHVLGFVVVIVTVVYDAPRANAHEIFTQFYNLGGWQTTTLSFFIGWRGNAGAVLGADAAVHMSEEVRDSNIVVPRAMILSLLINGVMGFALTVAMLFSGGNLYEVAQANTSFPYTLIFANAMSRWSPVAGPLGVSILVVVLASTNGLGAVSSASRMLWSFARDKGMPGWKPLSKVSTRDSIPVWAVITVIVVSGLLAVINVGSNVAFNIIVSLVLEGLYGSYLIVIAVLLYRRLKGDIVSHRDEITREDQFVWGPWRLPRLVGLANNIFACAYLFIIIFFGFWPAVRVVNDETMNWSVVIVGGVIILSTVYYYAWGNREYKGPIVELDVADAVAEKEITVSEASKHE